MISRNNVANIVFFPIRSAFLTKRYFKNLKIYIKSQRALVLHAPCSMTDITADKVLAIANYMREQYIKNDQTIYFIFCYSLYLTLI